MTFLRNLGKDRIGAVLLVALGVLVLTLGLGYSTGNLNHMGAGFVPVVLGVLLVVLGLAIGFFAAPHDRAPHTPRADVEQQPALLAWRAWVCVLGGVVAFVLLGQYGGLISATFASVLVSASGDRDSTLRSSATLAAVLTAFCLVIFHFGLGLQLPLFRWG